jgi:hypothetical protein
MYQPSHMPSVLALGLFFLLLLILAGKKKTKKKLYVVADGAVNVDDDARALISAGRKINAAVYERNEHSDIDNDAASKVLAAYILEKGIGAHGAFLAAEIAFVPKILTNWKWTDEQIQRVRDAFKDANPNR